MPGPNRECSVPNNRDGISIFYFGLSFLSQKATETKWNSRRVCPKQGEGVGERTLRYSSVSSANPP
jgi:hypothetical protein